jgi:UDP-GlcNAc:undecaprenyl-phosphate GlcNAc-1-phosphate transferase
MTLAQLFMIFLSALVLSVVGTPLVRRLAISIGVVDQPNARKVHAHPVPLLGGIAIYGGVVLTLVLWSGSERSFLRELGFIFLGATIVVICGALDDKWGLSASLKLFGQVLGCIAIIYGGVRVQLFGQPALNIALTMLWVLGISNAINFLDNMDGLSGGITAVASAFFLQLAVLNSQVLVAALSAALLGACIGFLRHNFVPTRIFMGDTGSLFLGFVLAVLGIKLRFPSNSPVVTWMIPVVVLGLPVFDTTLVIIARLRRRVNPFNTPGRDHISHRFVALGASKREAVLMCYMVAGGFGIVATMLTQASVREAYALVVLLLLLAVSAIWWLERRARYVP